MRPRAAYEKAKERNRAALAEAKRGQRVAYRKARERRGELVAEQKKQRPDRGAAARAERDEALLRKLVRPATTLGADTASAAPASLT